jgi:LysM repeat protein
MNIAGPILLAQYQKAKEAWPFIEPVEQAHGLPAMLLYALGSRETNLRNVMGDKTQRKGESSPRFHGFGVWQRDSGSFAVDESYLKDVRRQADDAAALLATHHRNFGRWDAAVAAYNCGAGNVKAALAAGQPVDLHTAGNDYSADVLARHAFLVAHAKGDAAPKTAAMGTGPAAPRSTASSLQTYTVRPGDTLSAIAARHHTTVAALVAKNHIKDPNHIVVGQVLRLP